MINAFKSYYKQSLNNFINFKLIDENCSLKDFFGSLNLLQILHWVTQAFEHIGEQTTLNCWKKLIHLIYPVEEKEIINDENETTGNDLLEHDFSEYF